MDFPLRLYKDCPYFVPPLYPDEKKIFSPGYFYYQDSEAVYFNAYENGKIVGRISGILQKKANEKWHQKRVRFTRFDTLNSPEIAAALFGAVENWAKAKGMDEVIGPLQFSDLDREGLLIEGFDELSTFEEQYNYPYYQKLIEDLGYQKEVDWTERKLYAPKEVDPRLEKVVNEMMEKNHLHFAQPKNTRALLKDYGDQFFEIVDATYQNIYQTVPLGVEERKSLMKGFRMILNPKRLMIIVDEKGKVVCFGLGFPSLSKALQKSRGHMSLACLYRLEKAIRHPEILDCGLIGVRQEYQNTGIEWAILILLIRILQSGEVLYAETNLNLEDNLAIQNCWKRFDSVIHKRRRSYVKKLL